jgi:hypothetical protein
MQIDLKRVDVIELPIKKFIKIEDFAGYNLIRYKAIFRGKLVKEAEDGDDEDLDFELEFSSKYSNSSDALMRMFELAEISLGIDMNGYKGNADSFMMSVDYKDFDLSKVADYIRIVRSDITSIALDEIYLIDSFKYVLYSNMKWISELMRENLDGIKFASNLNDLYDMMDGPLRDLKQRENGTLPVPTANEQGN